MMIRYYNSYEVILYMQFVLLYTHSNYKKSINNYCDKLSIYTYIPIYIILYCLQIYYTTVLYILIIIIL